MGTRTASAKVIPCSGSFKEVTLKAELLIRVLYIQLRIVELSIATCGRSSLDGTPDDLDEY